MHQQVHINGYIDVPEHWVFPDVDERIELGNVTVEVRGEKTRKNKTSGEASTLKHTLDTVMLSGAEIGRILPPAPNLNGQTRIEDDETQGGDEPTPITKPRKPRTTRKTPATVASEGE